MDGPICLITGATAGIGRVTAIELARLGATIIAVGRNRERGKSLLEEIQRMRAGNGAAFIATDLSRRSDIHQLAGEIGRRYSRVDILINNAGVMFGERRESVDGHEMTFAVNHLAAFQLTNLLGPMLAEAKAARIINVSSDAHRMTSLDFDDLENRRSFDGWTAYRRSKLANIYFTYELARRVRGTKVTVNALSPGIVDTEIGLTNGYATSDRWQTTMSRAVSASEGARTSIFLASDAAIGNCSGMYFVNCQPTRSSVVSYDAASAGSLWEKSLELVLQRA